MNIFSFVIVLNAVIIYGLPAENCNNGPEYWCRNANTIEECNAAEVCEMLSSNTEVEGNDKNQTADAAPVEVTLFFEALCPYCRNFVQGQLYPTWRRLRKTGILKVVLYAYGNAYERWDGGKWVYRCQHGARECQLNLFETCAFKILNDDQKVPFIHCLEANPQIRNGRKCVVDVGGDWLGVYRCYMKKEGNDEQHRVKELQSKLQPRLKFVPWILVNGYHSDNLQGQVQQNMLYYVCNAYKGTRPSECN